MKQLLAVCAFLMYSSVSFANASFEPNTLGGNDEVPNKLIESLLEDQDAKTVLETPYMAFYEVKGKVSGNKMRFDDIIKNRSFPDERLAALALGIAAMANRPAFTTGSRIQPSAMAYVVFYDGKIDAIAPERRMLLPTSVDKEPNTTAILVVRNADNSNARDARITASTKGRRDGSDIYVFDLAI